MLLIKLNFDTMLFITVFPINMSISSVRLGSYDFNITTMGLHVSKFKSLYRVILTLYSAIRDIKTMGLHINKFKSLCKVILTLYSSIRDH